MLAFNAWSKRITKHHAGGILLALISFVWTSYVFIALDTQEFSRGYLISKRFLIPALPSLVAVLAVRGPISPVIRFVVAGLLNVVGFLAFAYPFFISALLLVLAGGLSIIGNRQVLLQAAPDGRLPN